MCACNVAYFDPGSLPPDFVVRSSMESYTSLTKAHASDEETLDPNVRKVRALRQMEDMQHMVEAIQGIHPDLVREARQFDRRPLTSWSDSSKTVVLIGDAAHAMYSGREKVPGHRSRMPTRHQLCYLLQEVFSSPHATAL